MNATDQITIQQAYAAMYRYLEKLYEQTQADELGGMLGSMSLLPDGQPADPAVWSDWLQAINEAKEGQVNVRLSLDAKSQS